MKHIVDWSNAHFMEINPDKTEILLLIPPSLNKEVLIHGMIIGGQCIRFSKQVKDVGVVLRKPNIRYLPKRCGVE